MTSKLVPVMLFPVLAACTSSPDRTLASPTSGLTPSAKLEQHAWLEQLVGEWETEARMPGSPGVETTTLKGKESVRAIGGLWVVADLRGDSPAGPMHGMLTIGYDEGRKRYVGTWIDSMVNHLWTYEGTLDAAGRKLSLDAEGPSFAGDGTLARYRDVYELHSRDRKTITSSVQGPDGAWTTYMTAEYRRVK